MALDKPKLIRITTVPLSLNHLLKGQLRFMNKHLDVIGVASGPRKELEIVANREGVPTVQLEMTRTISPFKDMISLWKFYKLCKKEKPTIVHSHTPKAGIVGMLGARLAGVPIRIHTVAGLPLMEARGSKRKLLNLVEKLTYRFATHVYPNSKGLYDFIIAENFANSSKLKIIGQGSSNGIDTTYFNPDFFSTQNKKTFRQELNISENTFVFIFVGRLVGDKGINELVSAFRNLNSTRTQRSKLLLVGPFERELDSLHPETEREIRENPDILSVGYQPDVRPYFSIADSLVFPSYREGFPNVVMQAGAMGLPSIVTDINGCNEIIVEGKNGIIIPPKDANTLETAMRRFLEKPEYVAQLAKNARRMITDRYEQLAVWDALLEEYKRLLKEKEIEFKPCTKTT